MSFYYFKPFKILHQNLSIVNPLLQVMESGFKHGNNDVKSFTYECWTSLTLNFALDRGNFKFYYFKSEWKNVLKEKIFRIFFQDKKI